MPDTAKLALGMFSPKYNCNFVLMGWKNVLSTRLIIILNNAVLQNLNVHRVFLGFHSKKY